MKTFEEKWTAWVDDELKGSELAEFEASLPDSASANAEKQRAKKLGLLLKRQLAAEALRNEEFFNHQLRQRIQAEAGRSWGRAGETDSTTRWGWSMGRLVWAGAAALAIFIAMAVGVMRQHEPVGQSEYLTQILQAKVDPAVNPNATITTFEAKQGRVTVLWTEGLKSVPSDYAAK